MEIIKPVDEEGGRGGDIIISPGKGYTAKPGYVPAHGRILFKLATGEEAIRIDRDGAFFVKGRPVTSDMTVFKAFAEWIENAYMKKDPDVPYPPAIVNKA